MADGRILKHVEASKRAVDGYVYPPSSPSECIFARTTHCLSADLETHISPCQIGGNPDCARCGCLASAALAAVGRYKLGGRLSVSRVLDWSEAVGRAVGRLKGRLVLPGAHVPEPSVARVIPVRSLESQSN